MHRFQPYARGRSDRFRNTYQEVVNETLDEAIRSCGGHAGGGCPPLNPQSCDLECKAVFGQHSGGNEWAGGCCLCALR